MKTIEVGPIHFAQRAQNGIFFEQEDTFSFMCNCFTISVKLPITLRDSMFAIVWFMFSRSADFQYFFEKKINVF